MCYPRTKLSLLPTVEIDMSVLNHIRLIKENKLQ